MQTIQEIKSRFTRPDVKLVAVSKTKPPEKILEIYNQGQRIFGENRAMELKEKAEQLPDDIEWHMIGHLQRNKVKYIMPHVAMIHSIDSIRLAREVNKQAGRLDRKVPGLLQIKIAREESKYGFEYDALQDWLDTGAWKELDHIVFSGVMGMASFVSDMEIVREEFKYLVSCFNHLKQGIFEDHPSFNEISMGMSGDYRVAIEEGSTMVRIGTLIFGEREKH